MCVYVCVADGRSVCVYVRLHTKAWNKMKWPVNRSRMKKGSITRRFKFSGERSARQRTSFYDVVCTSCLGKIGKNLFLFCLFPIVEVVYVGW